MNQENNNQNDYNFQGSIDMTNNQLINSQNTYNNLNIGSQINSRKKVNPFFIIIPTALIIVVAIIFLLSNKFKSIAGLPASNDLKSVQKVIISFVNYIKEDNYDKALTLIYDNNSKNAYLPSTDTKIFYTIKEDNTKLNDSLFKYTETDSEPFLVKIEGSTLSYSIIKVDDKYYIYNFQKLKYGSPDALQRNKKIAILSGIDITINNENASKYKTSTQELKQYLTSNMISNDMYVPFDEKVDIYEMSVGYSFDVSLSNNNYKLVTDNEISVSSDEEKYNELTIYQIEPADNNAYDYANTLFKNILNAGFNKKDFSEINIKFNSEDTQKEFIDSYNKYIKNMFEDYSERGGKITVTGYNYNNEEKVDYFKLGDNKWLVKINYNISRTKNYIYSNGTENIVGDKHTTDYNPVIILEKKENEYYIEYISSLAHVFREYNGR